MRGLRRLASAGGIYSTGGLGPCSVQDRATSRTSPPPRGRSPGGRAMRKALYILGLFSDEEIDWLAAAGRKETYRPGDVLIQEGRSPDSLFILLDGKLQVTAGKKAVAALDSGEIVGELSYVDSRPASATVAAVAPSLVLRVPREVVSA